MLELAADRAMRRMLAGADETKLTREALKWPYGEFEIPNEVYDAFSAAGKKGKALEEEWNKVQAGLLQSMCSIIECDRGGQVDSNCPCGLLLAVLPRSRLSLQS